MPRPSNDDDPDPLNALNNYHQALKLPNASIRTTPVQKLRVTFDFAQPTRERILDTSPAMEQMVRELERGKLVIAEKKQATRRQLARQAIWIMEMCFPELKRNHAKNKEGNAKNPNGQSTESSKQARKDTRRQASNSASGERSQEKLGRKGKGTGAEKDTNRSTNRISHGSRSQTSSLEEVPMPPSRPPHNIPAPRTRPSVFGRDSDEEDEESEEDYIEGRERDMRLPCRDWSHHANEPPSSRTANQNRALRHQSLEPFEGRRDGERRTRSLDSFGDEDSEYRFQPIRNEQLGAPLSSSVRRSIVAGEEHARPRPMLFPDEHSEYHDDGRHKDAPNGEDQIRRLLPPYPTAPQNLTAPSQKRPRSGTPEDDEPRKSARYE